MGQGIHPVSAIAANLAWFDTFGKILPEVKNPAFFVCVSFELWPVEWCVPWEIVFLLESLPIRPIP